MGGWKGDQMDEKKEVLNAESLEAPDAFPEPEFLQVDTGVNAGMAVVREGGGVALDMHQ
jgi:class 3 adenylate cyclase